MNETTPSSQSSPSAGRTVFYLLAVYLICTFLWRVLTPADEYPMRTSQVMTMALDFLALAALVALKRQLHTSSRAEGGAGTMAGLLFALALIAGLGLFAIRLNGDASWWTGHLRYEMGPRR